MNETIQTELHQITMMAELHYDRVLAKALDVPIGLILFSFGCVGVGLRKGTIPFCGEQIPIKHFTHMCRVTFLMKHFFPGDVFGRNLAMVHDAREECLPGKGDSWKGASSIANMPGLSKAILLSTEQEPTDEQVRAAASQIPKEFDAKYIAKYREFIALLRDNWPTIGNMELCDRLDGATSFSYLEDPQYADRLKYKALETFGRIWATIALSKHEVTEEIQQRCRPWFEKFGITEREVEAVSLYFTK